MPNTFAVAAGCHTVKNLVVDPAHTRQELRSDDPDRRARAYENLIFSALQLGEADVEAMAAAYRYLSERLLERRRGEVSGAFERQSSSDFDNEHLQGVWGLVFGWRTFEVARRLLAEARCQGGLAVEIGGGWGPYALQAALHGFDCKVVDASASGSELMQRVFSGLGLEVPERHNRPASPDDVRGAQLVALPYSLWEIRDPRDVDGADAWLRELLSRAGESASLHIVEAGNRDAALALQRVRDRLAADGLVRGPCRGAASCPRLAKDDWCHFTWRSSPGRLTRRIADLAGRRWQETHSSWLAIGSGPEGGTHRLLEVRRRGKAKVEAELCGASGIERITALRRQREVLEMLTNLEASALVDLDRRYVEPKGDGLRLVGLDALRRATPTHGG